MKFDLISDLHLDFHRDWKAVLTRLRPQSNTLVLAGDLAEFRNPCWMEGLRDLSDRWAHVVYVSGNHELYGRGVSDWSKYREQASGISNLHWLERESITLEGVQFHGATGWFKDLPDNVMYQGCMNDFRVIRGLVPWCYENRRLTEGWLQDVVKPGDVVVTHHLPTSQCVAPRWQGQALNRFFVSSFDLAKIPASLWVFGHTHDSIDCVSPSGTRLVSNPAGYPGEKTGLLQVLTLEAP